jgi:hypothetical protein
VLARELLASHAAMAKALRQAQRYANPRCSRVDAARRRLPRVYPCALGCSSKFQHRTPGAPGRHINPCTLPTLPSVLSTPWTSWLPQVACSVPQP